MNYLNYLIESILTEEVQITKITDAIRKRKPVRITYKADDEPKGQGERIIHPVAYGLSKSGNMVLRAFQPYGDTKTKTPNWKLFRIDKISKWNTLWKRSSFNEPPGQFNSEGDFNPNGDKTMNTVYLVANFQNSKDFYSGQKGQGLMNYNKKRQQQKQEKDPFYKIRQNISNADNDDTVIKRINKNPSINAKKYVNNDDFIKDMNKVNIDTTKQMQTSEPIEKGDVKQNNDYDVIDDKKIQNITGPITKNNNIKIDNNERDEIERYSDESITVDK